MRRDQDRAALREQKARIIAELRELGLTHDPRFRVSQSSVCYEFSPPRPPTGDRGGFMFVHGGFGVNEPRERRTVRR